MDNYKLVSEEIYKLVPRLLHFDGDDPVPYVSMITLEDVLEAWLNMKDPEFPLKINERKSTLFYLILKWEYGKHLSKQPEEVLLFLKKILCDE
jgi:hypothetical protein